MKTGFPWVLSWMMLATFAGPSLALPRFGDWARDPNAPNAGQAIANAWVTVRTEGGDIAALFSDAQKTRLANPFRANEKGYYQFFVVETGNYQISLSRDRDDTSVFYRKTTMLVDPIGPQTVFASPQKPALTLTQVTPSIICIGEGDCCNAALRPPCADAWIYNQWATTQVLFERRSASGVLDDAPWTFNGFLAERGHSWHYNSLGAQVGGVTGDPLVAGYPVDNVLEDNIVDMGNLGLPSIIMDWHGAGIIGSSASPPFAGIWLSSEAGKTVNVDMAIAGTAPEVGEVVALSTTAPGAVSRTTTSGARAPFVVTSVQGSRATVAVSGLAVVNATAPIAVGDALMTSTVAGYAIKAPPGTPAPSTLGSALTGIASDSGVVRVRIGMLSQ